MAHEPPVRRKRGGRGSGVDSAEGSGRTDGMAAFYISECLSEQALRCGEYIERSKGQEEQEGAGLKQKWDTGGGANLRALQRRVEDWALSNM